MRPTNGVMRKFELKVWMGSSAPSTSTSAARDADLLLGLAERGREQRGVGLGRVAPAGKRDLAGVVRQRRAARRVEQVQLAVALEERDQHRRGDARSGASASAARRGERGAERGEHVPGSSARIPRRFASLGSPCYVPAHALRVVRYHEIALKGGNRQRFVQRLISNLRDATVGLGVRARREPAGSHRAAARAPMRRSTRVCERVAHTFGVANYSVGVEVPVDLDAIRAAVARVRAPPSRSRPSRCGRGAPTSRFR